MPLYDFQRDDILWWDSIGRRGIFAWGIGTGKTYVGAKLVKRYAQEGRRVLVVAPPSLIRTWRDMCECNGVALGLAWKNGNDQLVICTYDRLKTIAHIKFDLIIADEAHRIKNYDSKRSKIFRGMANNSKDLLLMTGTLSNHRDAIELLNYLWCINTPHVRENIPLRITPFRDKYCYKKQISATYSKWIVRREGISLVNDVLSRYVRFRDLRKEQEIPPLTDEVRYLDSSIDLKAKAKVIADSLNLDEQQIDVNYGHPHITHALMLANGIDFETGEITNRAKLDEITDILDQLEETEQCIIWVYWRKFGEELAAILGDKCRLINGGVSDKKKDEYINDFRAGKYPYLVASIGSIAEGHNLQNCHIAIVANQWYDVIKDAQSRGRIERTGQTERMTIIRLVGEETLEEDVLHVLKMKMRLHEAHDYLRSALDRKLKRYL